MSAFFASNLQKANEALDLQSAFVRQVRAYTESRPTSRPRNARTGPGSPLGFLLRPVEHIAKYYGTISQITINRALESPAQLRPAGPTPPSS